MSINRVNTGGESFNFLTNQSSILHTVDTNKITVNGVNVIVDKPKRGDIMCITKDQKVIWIDGLSIEPKQLSKEFEPVGICLVVKGNKALVRYKEEKQKIWAASERWEIPESSIMSDGFEHSLKITLNGVENPTPFKFSSRSKSVFVSKLNKWFLDHDASYSAELVELDTDHSAYSKDENGITILNPKNRIIVNARIIDGWKTIKIEEIGSGTRAIAKHINAVNWYYKNNGFEVNYTGGCCRAKYYDYIQANQVASTALMTSINSAPDPSATYPLNYMPAKKADFDSNSNCQLLRDNFATYDDYLDSWMAKFPCGAGGTITEFPSGKENTYKLADCAFLDNTKGEQEVLYPAANWAASIDLNAPKLEKGNWWLPSSAEMVEIMRDITHKTTFWETKPDIINRVIKKLNPSENSSSSWTMLTTSIFRWTSSRYNPTSTCCYYANLGNLSASGFWSGHTATAITIYEF